MPNDHEDQDHNEKEDDEVAGILPVIARFFRVKTRLEQLTPAQLRAKVPLRVSPPSPLEKCAPPTSNSQ